MSETVSNASPVLLRRVAIVVLVWAISEPLLLDGEASRLNALLFGLVLTVPLLFVRRAPIFVALLVTAAYLTQTALSERMASEMSPELALAFALFGVAAYVSASDWRSWAALPIAAAVPAGLWAIAILDLGDLAQITTMQYLYPTAVAVAGVLPGLALRGRKDEVATLEGEVAVLYAQAAAEIGVAVDDERRSLSRGMVRVVDGLVTEVRGLVPEAREAMGVAGAQGAALGRRMADAARRAGDELRSLLGTLTAQPAAEPVAPPRARPDLRGLVGLAAPTVGLALLGVVDRMQVPDLPVEILTPDGPVLVVSSAVPAAVGYALAILTPVGLLLRRRWPVVAVVWVAAFVVLRAVLDDVSSLNIAQVFTCGVLAYMSGAWPRSLPAAAFAGLVTLATAATCWILEQYHFGWLEYAYMVGVMVGAWAVGRAVHRDLLEALALRRRAAVLRSQRDRLCRVAIRGERRDVAREMHDLVGHGLSLIVVQSGVVEVLAERQPARALEALDLVDDAARTTQAELEALRVALGDPAGDPAGAPDGDGRSHACSWALRRIVADAREAGQPVTADVDPQVDELEPDLRTAVVRIVQEALTNARKHADGADVRVAIAVRAERVELRVDNGAGVALAAAPRGSHLGVDGMAERARTRGGTFAAGPDGHGGWSVCAELPRAAAGAGVDVDDMVGALLAD